MKALVILFCTCAMLQAGQPTLVYLVRHSEKVDSSKDADLSKRGLQRSEELASFFSKIQLDVLIASEYQRTQKTLEPTATAKHLKINVILAGSPEQLVALVKHSEGKTLMIAAHSDTLPDLIKRLGGPVVTIADDAYRDLFLLVLQGNEVTLQNFQREP